MNRKIEVELPSSWEGSVFYKGSSSVKAQKCETTEYIHGNIKKFGGTGM